MLKPFCDWLEARAGLELGVNLEAGKFRPSSGELCTAVIEGAARTDDLRKDLRERVIQLLTRGPDLWAARNEAFRLYELVVNQYGLTALPGWFVHSITGGEPQSIGTDAGGREVYSTNLLVLARKKETD